MINFKASLCSSGKAISIDSEGSSVVKLEVPALDLAEVIRIMTLAGKTFTVEIREEAS